MTTASGLRYKDIIVGKGPSPPTGYQVLINHTHAALHLRAVFGYH